MTLPPEIVAELEILTLFNLDNHLEGLKVHSDAGVEQLKAVSRLHNKGLISQPDGGYLTSLGRDAAEHIQALAQILNS